MGCHVIETHIMNLKNVVILRGQVHSWSKLSEKHPESSFCILACGELICTLILTTTVKDGITFVKKCSNCHITCEHDCEINLFSGLVVFLFCMI